MSLLNDWSCTVRVIARDRVRVGIFRVGLYSDTLFTPGQLNSYFTFNSCYPVCVIIQHVAYLTELVCIEA